MNDQDRIRFNAFRELCLRNAEDFIKTAESLLNKDVNHIVFQLSVFGLEEIGKIFLGWYQMSAEESWDKEHYDIPLDDHIKKLFWAIWGPSFANEKFTKEQMDEIQGMASKLHNKRLDVMYTELTDTVPSSAKISDSEAGTYVRMALARLKLAKIEGSADTRLSTEQEQDSKWFTKATDNSVRRKYIFSNYSQEKLIEFGNVQDWIEWLKKHFNEEERELSVLLEEEIQRVSEQGDDKSYDPKWRIRFTLNTPSHSIRANIVNKFSLKSPHIKFAKGGDNHTLLVDIILDKKTNVVGLWSHGWSFSNLLVASLNVGTNGLFYWNIPKDVDQYYDTIWDIENNRQLSAKLETSLQLDWSSKKLVLAEKELAITFIVFGYFSRLFGNPEFEPVNDYITALGMLAKSDMHLRLEDQCFLRFFLAFEKAIVMNENCSADSIKEVGYKLLENVITERTEFDAIIDKGLELQNGQGKTSLPISLTDIIGIKQYIGIYFIILAHKEFRSNKGLTT